MDIIDWIIEFIFCGWLLGSSFVSAYWFFEPDEWFWKKHKYITGVIATGAFLCVVLVVTIGVVKLLRFIPIGWTTETEDGERSPLRYFIATLIGLATVIFLSVLFGKVQKMYNENRCLKGWLKVGLDIKGEIKKRKKRLYTISEGERKQLTYSFRTRLEELSFLQGFLSEAEMVEKKLLVGLLDELDKTENSQKSKQIVSERI